MNILIISPVYPTPATSNNPTKVVHYFAKEWQRNGENVRVINIPSYFLRVFYNLPKFVEKIANKIFGSAVFKTQNKLLQRFNVDEIPVLSAPLFKWFPGTKVPKRIIRQRLKDIKEYLKTEIFKPDVIVAHWTEPSMPFISALKHEYNCPTVMVTHSNKIKFYEEYIPDVDLWGYRCNATVESFKIFHPTVHFGFRCYSGIPSIFLINRPTRNYETANRYIYVGMMLPRKHPDKVIDAVSIVHCKKSDYKLTMIGEGALSESLKKKISDLNAYNQIALLGQLNREAIIKELDSSDIFIMISSGEVFGLVYIEAMARGCIVIASKNEGMEGIINNGVNGFLVEAGNTGELCKTISHIHSLTPEERKKISDCAVETASSLTDEKVAAKYLEEIKQLVAEYK